MFSWRVQYREVALRKYLSNQDVSRGYHAELASIFFSEDGDDNSEKSPENPAASSSPVKETPFQSAPQTQDVTYTLRHVEEAWLHLLRASDVDKLKKLAVCAFDFLLASAQMISVSYLRCVLEHARRYLLERDLELVYYAVRKSSDVLTRDPLQLAAQLICWLRPVAEDGGDLVSLFYFLS
jgi:NACHT domain- and WD repeat-containing protein